MWFIMLIIHVDCVYLDVVYHVNNPLHLLFFVYGILNIRINSFFLMFSCFLFNFLSV